VLDLLGVLGKRIHELRAAKKWSQEEFAHISGFHRTYIGQIERGEKNISFSNLVKVAGVLGVTLSELLSELEVKGPGVRQPSKTIKSHQSALRARDIQKLVRQLRVQQDATDRTLVLLEDLARLDSPAATAMRSHGRKHRSGKK
jgi:transcriptional regulator with XRE-family HTH domain